MKCPICFYKETRVADSRVGSDGITIRRRRECLRCGFRFSTMEEVEILELMVLKRGGRKESYAREKIEKGLLTAFEKRPVTKDRFRKLINKIERGIQIKRKPEITSLEIGEIVMKELRKVDPVAYIRFVSVYRAFPDIETFQKELSSICNKKIKSKRRSS